MKTCDCLRQFKTSKGLLIHRKKKQHGIKRSEIIKNCYVRILFRDVHSNFDLCGEQLTMYYKTWQTRAGNKYGAVKSKYDGNLYDSQKEARKAGELDMLLKAKQIKSWKKQIKEELRGENGTRICNYFCDFLVEHNDGMLEYLEIKSKATATPIWRIKWKLLQDKYKDDLNIRFTVEY